LSATTTRFLEQLGIEQYSLYLHDYGGPAGFRMMQLHPERLRALIIQNANVYQEGFGAKWTAIASYWADRAGHPEVFEAFVSQAATEQRHTSGTSRSERYNPDTWTDEFAFLSRPGQQEIQAELLYDYRNNVASYPTWQSWLRAHQPPTLILWGRNDPSFIAAGALSFKRDLTEAEVICSTPVIFPWMREPMKSPASFFNLWKSNEASSQEHRLWHCDTAQCIHGIFSSTRYVQQQEAPHNAEILVKTVHALDLVRTR
jgi:pimeloyl-ACP methyl ester carboxylesterase